MDALSDLIWFDLIWFSILSKNTDIAPIKNTIGLKIAIIYTYSKTNKDNMPRITL